MLTQMELTLHNMEQLETYGTSAGDHSAAFSYNKIVWMPSEQLQSGRWSVHAYDYLKLRDVKVCKMKAVKCKTLGEL